MAEVDLTTVKELLGHKTLEHDTQVRSPGQVKSVGVLDKALNEKIYYTKTVQFGGK